MRRQTIDEARDVKDGMPQPIRLHDRAMSDLVSKEERARVHASNQQGHHEGRIPRQRQDDHGGGSADDDRQQRDHQEQSPRTAREGLGGKVGADTDPERALALTVQSSIQCGKNLAEQPRRYKEWETGTYTDRDENAPACFE